MTIEGKRYLELRDRVVPRARRYFRENGGLARAAATAACATMNFSDPTEAEVAYLLEETKK